MSDGVTRQGRDEGTGDGGAAAYGRRRRRLLPRLLVGLLALFLLSAVAAPLIMARTSTGSDDEAKGLILGAASKMQSCAASRGGSYAGCTAARMGKLAPGIEWREGVAPYGLGWGDGRVGRVYVSVGPGGSGDRSYRLQTTSGSGYVFAYQYSGGSVMKTAEGSSEPVPW